MAIKSAYFRLIILVLIITISLYQIEALKFTDCNSGKQADAILKRVEVSNCDSDPVCSFKRGKNATIEVDFKTSRSFESANVEIYGKIGHVPIPFVLNPKNACGNYGFNCPVLENQDEKLKISMPILRSYPKIPVTVQLYMVDEKRRPIICVEFPARITDA